MTALPASPFAFAGVETPPDPVDGAISDALVVALETVGGQGGLDVAELGRALRAELRRMDIEAILVTRLDASRRRSDLVALSAYTLALAQRNAALKSIETAAAEIGRLRDHVATLQAEEGR